MGEVVACGGLDNMCSVYKLNNDMATTRAYKELAAHEGYLSCCRFLSAREIITSSGDATLILGAASRRDRTSPRDCNRCGNGGTALWWH